MLLWSRYLLSFSLLPLVIPLGVRLRKTIIRLPEAPGERRGFVGNAASTTFLLSLGESPIAGVGLEAQSQNLAPLLAKHLHQEKSNQVEWQILGKSGLRIGQTIPLFEPQLP
ncbi:MAG: hypothetical protein VX278_12710, partial [Myxococcota bacterium]|nr:hypothetical protein [Myxococcota bacterium]